MGALTQSNRLVPIERAYGLAPDIFYERYLSGCGKPVVVTDALEHWGALSKWTFDLFKSRYGSEMILVPAGMYSKSKKAMKLGDYIDYLDAPSGRSPGFWIDPETKRPRAEPPEATTTPLYLNGWNAFQRHPELMEDVELSPRFVEDWLPLLPPPLRTILDEATRYISATVLIGPKGSLSSLHVDFLHTHSYLAQIRGRKRCVLFSPDDSAALYDGRVDPDRPDFERFPLFQKATAFECTLEPGEVLFTPHRWWHHVVGLEKSITVAYNFFNRVNFSDYLADLLKRLPAVVAGLDASPDARAALGIEWSCRGFDLPAGGLK
jgi:hypothetical protein